MRYAILFLLVPTVLSLGSAQDKAAKSDLEKFQGAWQASFMIDVNGLPASDDEVKNAHLLVEGSKFTLRTKDAVIKGTFTLVSSGTPKAIDVTLEGQNPGEKFLGIYQITGDERRSCFALPGKDRPKNFDPKAKGFIQFGWKKKA